MANTKISLLPSHTTLASNDVLPVVSTANAETRKILTTDAGRDLTKYGLSVGSSTPAAPYTGQPWIDTSTATPLLKVYTGSTWAVSSIQPTSIVTSPGNSAPSNPTTGVLWLDTSATPVQLKAWDGSNWTQIDPDAVNRTASTGSAILPTGTTAQRDGSPAAGYLRFNSTLSRFEGYNGSAWGAVLVEDSSGNVGIGTSSPSAPLTIQTASSGWAEKILGRSSGNYSEIGFYNNDGTTFRSGIYSSDNNGLRFRALDQFIVAVGAAGSQDTERLRIDSSGRLLIGTSTSIDGYQLQIADTTGSNLSVFSFSSTSAYGPDITLNHSLGGTVGTQAAVVSGSHLGRIVFRGSDGSGFKNAAAIETFVDGTPGTNDMPGRLVFSTTADGASTPTERMRITNNGDVFIRTTTGAVSDTGISLNYVGQINTTTDGGLNIVVNRKTSDGTLVDFKQDGTSEGSISVSGTTVSYNGAHLSRWSQLPSGQERTEILRGTVLSNLDEMCEWGDEDNEQLNRMKVSDVEGDPNVAGVFQGWDDDDDTYINDFYCAMTGDFIIRIAADVTVERGDLLMSAGDGTAKPQDDDIVRSKTVAKVTSTTASCTYEDGSYCVPCVLMAC